MREADAQLRDLVASCGKAIGEPTDRRARVLDEKTEALVRVVALVAQGATSPSYDASVRAALAAGVSADEVVEALVAVSSTVGLARVVTASPALALVLGYDVDAAFEAPQAPDRSGDS